MSEQQNITFMSLCCFFIYLHIANIIVVFPKPGNVLYIIKNPSFIDFFICSINANCESYGIKFIVVIVESYFVSNINFGLLFAISNNDIPYLASNSLILLSKSNINN